MRISLLITAVWLIWFAFCLPDKPFKASYSTVLLDSKGQLLGARIADDGQWRFSASDSIPYKFKTCLLEFEDRNFYKHPGISAKGIGRALKQNFSNGRVVSGGSTITMQVARLMRAEKNRGYISKFIEMNMALRMELSYSKDEILNLYVSNAPFGNNVVGLEAASWRYFSRPSYKLSWAESATLAVLPNAPGLIYPGKNPCSLRAKRDRLLKRLLLRNLIDSTTYFLSRLEPIPDKPLPLPRIAPHLLDRLAKEGKKGQTVNSTVRLEWQSKFAQMIKNHMVLMSDNQVHNCALLVTEVKTGKVVCYIGNKYAGSSEDHSESVDCIMAPRSTGSILKPVLFAKSLEQGLITPRSLMLDVPTYFNGFSPKNFNYRYDGLVPANEALSRSLNIPFVRLLSEYGYEKFHHELKSLGLSTLQKPAAHYGLSMILGGAEAKLWDLNNLYARMGAELSGKRVSKVHYDPFDTAFYESPAFDKASIYATFEAMTELSRPDEDGNWMMFDQKKRIAWKTGTSFGFRDAWAIGITPDYVVSVWIGNADGEGRPGLTGIRAAAPLMFEVFRALPEKSPWFVEPIGGMRQVKICVNSGFRAGPNCAESVSSLIPAGCLELVSCPYHKTIFVDKIGKHRVDCECESPYELVGKSWFILAPGIEKYYRVSHPEYSPLPPYRKGCGLTNNESVLHILYPRQGTKIQIPVDIDGKLGSTLFEVAHRIVSTKVYWHIDSEYIGETRDIHQLKFAPGKGQHTLLVMDEEGHSQSVQFEVL